ncbi:hypothetical protein GB881_18545, partial [Georgenia subflava]|nr:hypothetical protein [Georgenia subflava]
MGLVVDTLLVGLRVVLSLAIVLAVLWFCARQLGGRGQATRRVPITVLGRQSLGRHSGISVVEVAGRTLVIGVSDAGVRLLTEVDTPAVEEGADAAAAGGVAGRAVDGAGDEDRPDGADVAALAAGA